MSAERPPWVVVLTPDLIGSALSDPRSLRVLQLWRDGQIRPAVHRELLVRYLRLLGQLGITERTLQWWAWWWTDPKKTFYVADSEPAPSTVQPLLAGLARRAGATCIVYSHQVVIAVPPEGAPWWTAGHFLERFEAPSAS